MNNQTLDMFHWLDGTYAHVESHWVRFPTLRLLWFHGWGQSRQIFYPLSTFFRGRAQNHLFDLPGFGGTPVPKTAWGTPEYANMIINWLDRQPKIPTICIGHSFGGRVAMRVAANRPDLVQQLVLLASSGIRRELSWVEELRIMIFKKLIHTLKYLNMMTPVEYLRNHMGSIDYRQAGAMRPILVKTVNESIETTIKSIHQHVLLIYGERDTQTPVATGRQLESLLSLANLKVIPTHDHYTILSLGYQLILQHLKDFIGCYYEI